MDRKNSEMAKYGTVYCYIAQGLYEALQEHRASLKVEIPSNPIQLMPARYYPRLLCDFDYVFKRTAYNIKGYDDAVQPRDVMALVRDYFDRAEYKNYALACVENNYEYRLTIRAQKGFVLGHSLRPEIGEFHFDANAPGVSSMQDSHGRWGRYDIAYHLGGTLGGLRDSQQFDLYVNGVWRPAYISCLSDGYPLLYPFQRHPDAYVGCLARASQGVRAARRA